MSAWMHNCANITVKIKNKNTGQSQPTRHHFERMHRSPGRKGLATINRKQIRVPVQAHTHTTELQECCIHISMTRLHIFIEIYPCG